MLVIAGAVRDGGACLIVGSGACGPQRGPADPVVVAHSSRSIGYGRLVVGGIITVTIGRAGQQQARSLAAIGLPSWARSSASSARMPRVTVLRRRNRPFM